MKITFEFLHLAGDHCVPIRQHARYILSSTVPWIGAKWAEDGVQHG